MTQVPSGSSFNGRTSSRFIEDGSYVRLKSLKISYNLSSVLNTKAGLEELELYLAGKNLLTLTSYSGMDPEVNYNSANSLVFGTDFFTCPQPKTILIGLCAKF